MELSLGQVASRVYLHTWIVKFSDAAMIGIHFQRNKSVYEISTFSEIIE